MVNLEGKVICNAFMKCNDPIHNNCNHRIPHEHSIYCRTACGGDGVLGGVCVPITRMNDQCIYTIESIDGFVTEIPNDPALEIPEFNMDEKIYICPSHASCLNDDCNHKVFHNKSQGCESECQREADNNGVCREANNDEILQLFRDHAGENQHIDDMLEQDDKVYSDLMDELTKPKPEKLKPVHERVKRFLNLEL